MLPDIPSPLGGDKADLQPQTGTNHSRPTHVDQCKPLFDDEYGGSYQTVCGLLRVEATFEVPAFLVSTQHVRSTKFSSQESTLSLPLSTSLARILFRFLPASSTKEPTGRIAVWKSRRAPLL
ncbi:hypothetical protein XPA_008410 [Xanthoria parietina]